MRNLPEKHFSDCYLLYYYYYYITLRINRST
jgi:hypothetical protein